MQRLFLLCFALVGCRSEAGIGQQLPDWGDSNPPDLPLTDWTDRLTQLSPPRVDVLFTIDNSSSMGNEQRLLIEHFPVFADFFVGSGLDYHIGVISTDIDNNNQNGHLHGARGYGYIDQDTIDPVGVFRDMASMGTAGSGDESGLGAIYNALVLHRQANGDYYRDDAELHTVVITDEEDQTPPWVISLDEWEFWYRDLKDSPQDRTFSSIVSFVDAPPADRGRRYLQMTASIGGIAWDITDEDWVTVLEDLSLQAAGQREAFFLSHWPVPDSIAVTMELPDSDVVVEFLPEEWTWDPFRNSIVFGTFVPEPRSVVVIAYTLANAL